MDMRSFLDWWKYRGVCHLEAAMFCRAERWKGWHSATVGYLPVYGHLAT